MEAAHITLDYMKDFEQVCYANFSFPQRSMHFPCDISQAILLLLKGEEWTECRRLVCMVVCWCMESVYTFVCIGRTAWSGGLD